MTLTIETEDVVADKALAVKLEELADFSEGAWGEHLRGVHPNTAMKYFRQASSRIQSLSERIPVLEGAVEALGKCRSCGGSGRYPDKGWRNGVFVTEEVECKKCDGTGVDPIARAALSHGGK